MDLFHPWRAAELVPPSENKISQAADDAFGCKRKVELRAWS
jgi:hypothetical protein